AKMSPPVNAGPNVVEKILQYENFINEVLKRDLQKVLEKRDSVYEKISQYLQLRSIIQSLQESGSQKLKADVDLGCNFYVQTEVEDSSRIFVAVGYGFFVEMTHEEALQFIEKKTSQLTLSVQYMYMAMFFPQGLRELQGLQDLPEIRRREIL
uniref:Ubiquitously-expressed, prefoldin-like chaperone n=1 Tax=Takifugu rubripes TaxID=31033 RepID=A0A674MA97_TAKRU